MFIEKVPTIDSATSAEACWSRSGITQRGANTKSGDRGSKNWATFNIVR